MTKTLVFDMDGTIADLYGVPDWLNMLRSENPMPYIAAQPIYNPIELNEIVNYLKQQGWRIVVTTWLSKGSTEVYDLLVKQAKIDWLDRMSFPYDELHIIKYGVNKADCTKHYGGIQVLVDDSPEVRYSWYLGETIDASSGNILAELKALASIQKKYKKYPPFLIFNIQEKMHKNSPTPD